jgi:RNA polymerase sigma-70 factor (ECF subfamily)
MRSMSDEEAISSLIAGQGNGAAFRALYERYASRGKGYAYSILRNESDSEEAVQEAFCRLLKPMGRGEIDSARGGFCAVFFGTLRNLCIDMLRKRRRRIHLPLEAVPEPCTRPVVGSAQRSVELEEKVRAAVEALPSHYGEALKLRLNGGLSYDQIAGILGCTHGQVRTWIYRGRRSLEARLKKEGLIEGME